MADEVVEIGPGPASESYLRGDRIIAAARESGAEGLHPGYGFLAENADFAEAVGRDGIKFIGPSPDAMRRMGGKAEAKAIAAAAGVPVVPGYQGDQQSAKALVKEAKRIGWPVMIKAVAGGGGRGMRLAPDAAVVAAGLSGRQRRPRNRYSSNFGAPANPPAARSASASMSLPSIITTFVCRRSPMWCSGSPSTSTRSAFFPTAIEPV